ncbi:TrmB family transcriptional regulator [Halorussus halobius]|uniref:TrmB family transcriptional regulator n=1 Tax=Halorussus halobius TaxID=1710537 RepID=UPI001092F105|nr:helix-turn-helix domain-containing protein [Halorussus halobius]
MTQEQTLAETVSLLQDLGLKEYEARCFLALSQVPSATAKEISELSEVPRTRVYDAVRVLEAQGLVEVHHSNPQTFRAVSDEEAASTLRQRYDDRIETLQTHLDDIELDDDESDERVQEVWSLTGHEGIESRTAELVEGASSEIVLLVVEEDILTDSLVERLRAATDRGVTVIVGGFTESIVARIESDLPGARAFETDLNWLVSGESGNEVAISRLLLVDRTRLLVSSFYPTDHADGGVSEQAVFANGLGNGVVVLIRRLISSGLLPGQDPAQ